MVPSYDPEPVFRAAPPAIGHRMSALVETPFVVTRESGRWRIGCCGMR